MAVKNYNVGDTLLIPMVVRDAHDLGNIRLESVDGNSHIFSDVTIKQCAIDTSVLGGVPQDTQSPVAPTGDPTSPPVLQPT